MIKCTTNYKRFGIRVITPWPHDVPVSNPLGKVWVRYSQYRASSVQAATPLDGNTIGTGIMYIPNVGTRRAVEAMASYERPIPPPAGFFTSCFHVNGSVWQQR